MGLSEIIAQNRSNQQKMSPAQSSEGILERERRIECSGRDHFSLGTLTGSAYSYEVQTAEGPPDRTQQH